MQLWLAFSCLLSLCTCVGTVSAGVSPYGQAAMGEGKGIARHRCVILGIVQTRKRRIQFNHIITNQTGDLSTHISVDCACEL
jgi:hypothetical protein